MSHKLHCTTYYINPNLYFPPENIGKIELGEKLIFSKTKASVLSRGGLVVSVGAYIQEKLFFLFLGRGRFFGLLRRLCLGFGFGPIILDCPLQSAFCEV